MALLDEFNNRSAHQPHEFAKRILFEVLDDLFARRGFDKAWNGSNDRYKEEILDTLLQKVNQKLFS
jgi:hypothetical protein